MNRRQLIMLLGGTAAAWSEPARAQQSAMPVIGLLNGGTFEAYVDRVAAFRQSLKEIGFAERQNVTIEYRSAAGRADRLPSLAGDLVDQKVAVIVAIGGGSSLRAAAAATSTIPIVFATGGDALANGFVKSF